MALSVSSDLDFQTLEELRHTGIHLIGDVPWGTHFCQFYQEKQDLIDTLVPYFKAGLENNEYCVWVTSEPLRKEEAKAALAAEVGNLGNYLSRGQLEILDYREWYTADGKFKSDRVLRAWVDRLEAALARGFDGLRLTGNTFWLEKSDWKDFTQYEAAIDAVIGQCRMLAMCTYSLARCGAIEIVDVISNHAFALIKRSGKWEIIESAGRRRREQLESLVKERTRGLEEANAQLQAEIAERKQAEAALRESEAHSRTLSETMFQGVVYQDAEGNILSMNPAAVAILGKTPEDFLGTTSVDQGPDCVREDGSPFPGLEHPSMVALATGREVRNVTMGVYNSREKGYRWLDITAVPLFRSGEERPYEVYTVFQDITERKRMEETLRQSLERLEKVLEVETVGVMFWDLNTGCMTGANETFLKLMGYSRSEVEAGELFWQKLTPPEYFDLSRAEVEKFLKTGRVGPYEKEYFCKDGTRRWLLFAGSSLGGNQCVEFCVDIADRKQAEQALRDSETRFRSVLDGSRDVIYRFNMRTGHYEYISPSVATVVGFSVQELMVQDSAAALAMVHPDDRPVFEAAIARLRETGSIEAEYRQLTKSGEYRWLSNAMSLTTDEAGQPLYRNGNIRDITERRRAEEALRESDQRLRSLFENSTDAIFLTAVDGRIFAANPSACAMFGMSEREIRENGRAALIAPDDPRVAAALETRLREGRVHAEFTFVRKDGSRFEGDVTSIVLDEAGDAFVIVHDITERKMEEERLRQAQKLESLGLLAGGVAHDFNNLLVGVIGNASLASEMLEADHPAAELVQGVIKAGEQAAHLTRQMLAYSGKGKFLMEQLDLSVLVPEMVSLVQPSIPKKIALRMDLDDKLPSIEADRGQVQQVFMNLALNAAEAIGSQEGAITVSTGLQVVDDAFVRIHPEAASLEPGQYVSLAVRDTGCGMDESTRAKIFDPFFSTKFIGRGLGLAAVAGILRGHKAAILVTSAPGRGTTFTVLFPPSARSGKMTAPAPANRTVRGSGVVLVIDDEEVVREMARRTLERDGYTVLVAESGPAAIDILKRRPGKVDLAVLDLSMPGMNGEEVLPALRRLRPEMKVFVSSGYSEAEAMSMFHGQRVSGFIQKPYTSAALAERVSHALDSAS